MFIGREQELQFLNDRYNDINAQLIVLYGRRRIGKTETLREFCKDKQHVFFTCNQTTDKLQLTKFSNQLLKENIPAKQYISSFSDWESAFKAITTLPYGESKKLVVIDEFSYMCQGNKSIPSILQNLWDPYLKDQNIMIILCGSAMSYIEKELLSEKNPLYGRSTGIYKMKEMNFYDSMKFFPNYCDKDKVITYSILGGIPHYLKQWDNKLSVKENIKKNILTKGCVLYSEVEFLLHQELRETSIYNSIIESIAAGKTKLNEINQSSLINSTAKTSVYLKNLMELDIVERQFSIDVNIKEKSNNSKGIYHLTDNFFRFWYSFCFPNISELEYGDVDGIYDCLIEPTLDKYASYIFEDICIDFIREKQKNDELPFHFTNIDKWFGKTSVRDTTNSKGFRIDETEIDLLAYNKLTKDYLVGECKFKNTPFSYRELLDTQMKLNLLQEENNFYYALFSLSGFDEKIESNKNLLLFNIDEIINYK